MRIEASPASEAARLALAVYSDVLDAVRADILTAASLSLSGETLRIGTERLNLGNYERILVVGAGKASASMASAVEQALGSRIARGIVVTKHGHGGPTRAIQVMEAGHPTPDEGSVAAGRAIHALADSAGERDLVLCLLSGGASSLMELPRPPVTLDDLRATTDLLLRSGAPIGDLNAVRGCLSLLKSGSLARTAAPAQVVCLVLSDVLGSPLEVIGSGPCVDTRPEPIKARAVLERWNLLERVPPAVLHALSACESAPPPAAREARHVIIGDIHTALRAAEESAARHGLRPLLLTSWLEGEASQAGRFIGALARGLESTARATGYDCLILGGETTVTVRGAGVGGRSQETACAALASLRDINNVAVLAGSTDGADGPTDAAGALAERAICRRAADLGLDARAALRDNDAYPFLKKTAGLIMTGPTHSNVGDIVLLVMRDA